MRGQDIETSCCQGDDRFLQKVMTHANDFRSLSSALQYEIIHNIVLKGLALANSSPKQHNKMLELVSIIYLYEEKGQRYAHTGTTTVLKIHALVFSLLIQCRLLFHTLLKLIIEREMFSNNQTYTWSLQFAACPTETCAVSNELTTVARTMSAHY